MHRIDSATATGANGWTEGNPQGGIPATAGTADWFNAMQEEIALFIEAQGLTLDKLDNTQFQAAIEALLGGRQQFANELINGDFTLWQRGTAFALADALIYGPDRFFMQGDAGGGAGAGTLSRQTFALGQSSVPGNPTHYARFQISTPATVGVPAIGQRIEGMRRFFNRTLKVSFYAKTDVQVQGSLEVDRAFGAGGSARDNVHSETFTITSGWQRFSFDVTLPAHAGETIGTSDYLEVRVDLPAGTTYAVDVADFLVQGGTFLNPYSRVPVAAEALRAQRYFEKSYATDVTPGTVSTPGAATTWENVQSGTPTSIYSILQRFRVEKRAVPTVAWYSPSSGDVDKCLFGVLDRDIEAQDGQGTSGTGRFSVDNGADTETPIYAHWTADAELY